ncbi:hypothetical protein SDC9_185570 [bioreactor metagenome]|uniref:Uncharacterized protein n=1 Tax=bioreactor metagenome TaxID=1076179 RepID=A0A645HG86_9ZZZZ
MLNPVGSNQFVSDLFDSGGLAAHRQHFEAVMVIEVDVERGKNKVVMVVLDIG